MNMCILTNIAALVSSENESLPFRRRESEGVCYCGTIVVSAMKEKMLSVLHTATLAQWGIGNVPQKQI